MNERRVVPMAAEVADEVRKTMKAPRYGFAAQRQPAAGRAPCRQCLKLIRPQEEDLILFTYDAFQGQDVPPMPGPVYIHAERCEEYSGAAVIPEEYQGQPLTLEAFGRDRQRVAEIRVAGAGEAQAIEELLERGGVEYVHVRSTSAGCYLFRVVTKRAS
jgi:hypothetical protein